MADPRPWYHEGLPFTCTQCGDCCTGAPGYVWVNAEEIEAMMATLGESDRTKFERQYVRRIGVRKSLKEYRNGDCVFIGPGNEKMQRVCSTASAMSFVAILGFQSAVTGVVAQTCEVCPGSGRGELVQLEVIEGQRRQIRI